VKPTAQPIAAFNMSLEPLEGRQFLSAHTDHLHHLRHEHHLHHRHHFHVLHREHLHHLHTRHIAHRAHVLRTTVPEPIVLTAQQKNDWAEIREEFLANRKRIPK
jgi:hypothetical protein